MMKKFLLVPFASLILYPALLNPSPPPDLQTEGVEQLVYRYEMVPKGEDQGKGSAEIMIATANDHVDYAATISLSETREEIRIKTTHPGKLLSAQRKTFSEGRGPCCEEITITGKTVSVSKEEGGSRTTSEIDLPRNRELAVDGSLLLLVQSFPFGQGKKWELFMVDFSSFSTGVTIRQTGRERVTVPAGVFDCYRMELVLNIPIIKPKITYWITATEPHFVVRHQGKRGPFTATYVTSLLSVGKKTSATKQSAVPAGTGTATGLDEKPSVGS